MADDKNKLRTAAVEIAGRNWLTAQLLDRGIGAAIPAVDHGIDLIAFCEVGKAGIRALPLQLKCASAESFSLHKKYRERGIPLVYIWNALTQPVAHFLTYEEAFAVLGPASASASWTEGGYYAFNHISSDLRARLEPFRDRWHWIEDQLKLQPASGLGEQAGQLGS